MASLLHARFERQRTSFPDCPPFWKSKCRNCPFSHSACHDPLSRNYSSSALIRSSPRPIDIASSPTVQHSSSSRASPEHLRANPEQLYLGLLSQMGKQKEDDAPTIWELGTTLLFCDFCIKEIELDNRPTSHFNKDGWKNIMNNFNERIGRTYDRTQLKNKWDHLKKEWKLWKELLRGETGIGWDPIKKTVDASIEWWNEKIQVIPAAKKFRQNGLAPDLEEKMDRMFGHIVATGDNVWIPNSGVLPAELTHADLDTSNDDENQEDEPNLVNCTGGEGTTWPPSQKSQTSIPITSRKRKTKSCKSGGRQLLLNHINEVVIAAKSISASIATANADRKTFTIPEALHEVAQIPDIFDDEEFYDFATDFLQDKNRRETFMSIPFDRKVWWLRRRFFRSSL